MTDVSLAFFENDQLNPPQKSKRERTSLSSVWGGEDVRKKKYDDRGNIHTPGGGKKKLSHSSGENRKKKKGKVCDKKRKKQKSGSSHTYLKILKA